MVEQDQIGIPNGPLEHRQATRALPFRHTTEDRSFRHDLLTPAVVPDMHPAVARSVVDALEAGETRYTARTGIAPLRDAIARMVAEQGFPVTADSVAVTNGGSEARFIALQKLVSHGASVCLVESVDPDVVKLVEFMGGVASVVSPGDAASLDGVQVLLLPVASGIDGSLLADDWIITVLEAAARSGTRVILDRSSVLDAYVPQPEFSRPDLAGGVITIGSFSGACGLSGWRAGYFTAPADLMPQLAGLKESMSISTTTPTQFAMLATVEHLGEILDEFGEHASARRDHVTGMLDQAGLQYRTPQVYPGLLITVEGDDVAIAGRLAEEHSLKVEPASRYGASLAGHIRIDLRAADSALEVGITAIAAVLNEEAR